MCAGAVRLVISTIFITALLNYTSSSPQSVEQLNYKNNSRRNEERLDPNDYFKVRSEAVQALKDRQEYPYPHKFAVTTRFLDFAEAYNDISSGQVLDNVTVSVAGRVYSIRENRRKVVWDIVSEGIKIQITTNAKTYESESFTPDTEKLRKGDIIGCIGHPGKTSKGKLVIEATSIKLLAPSLRALPHSIDIDTRSRKRYLDLILNERVRQTFITRAKIISYIRRFLENMGFLEIETPLLNLIPGGAVAKPFLTHHDMLDQDLYLRISPELYHKKLVVGGLERVYEIGKQFRNEEIDVTHNPEFTTCEFYMAYADYNDLMTITETLLSGMVKSIFGSYKIKYHPYGAKGEERQIDFTPPFARVPMMATLERVLNVTLPLATELDTPEANSQLTQIFLTLGLAFPEPRSTTKLLDRLVYRFLESKLYNPTFILDHPQIMSPLAKEHRVTPGLTERFELYVMQKEISNAYTEQNDPVEQRKRLEKEAESRAAGDEEIPPTDEDFLTALEYGLPPTAGLGLGIDRLTMILTDITDIKDVLLFPAVNDKVEELPSLSKVPLIF